MRSERGNERVLVAPAPRTRALSPDTFSLHTSTSFGNTADEKGLQRKVSEGRDL